MVYAITFVDVNLDYVTLRVGGHHRELILAALRKANCAIVSVKAEEK